MLGDVREELALLPDRYIQTCVTSPPYWGLRDYGTATWDGASDDCDHIAPATGDKAKGTSLRGAGNRNGFSADGQYKQSCAKCGASRIDAQLGLEATPEEYVANMVQVFRNVRRVLKDDGTLWLNLGDSYARQAGDDSTKATDSKMKTGRTGKSSQLFKSGNNIPPPGLKPKDLVGIPWRVAFALQADGWYLRSDIIWHKPNPMPESVTDRPTKAHEYLFLLSKSERYYYDNMAIAEKLDRPEESERKTPARFGGADKWREAQKQSRLHSGNEYNGTPTGTRNKRTVWTVAAQPYAEAHFATFPRNLIEPCILAGSRNGDIVLDPFHGAGTSAMVSKQLGRKYVGIELNQSYIEMSLKRLQQEVLPLTI